MAATVTKLATQLGRLRSAKAGGPTVRAAIDGFLDSPNAKANPNTLRAYTSVLDRVAEEIGSRRKLAEVHDDEIAGALTELWDTAKPATWNRNRAAVGSWLAWCADKQHWAAPILPAAAQRRREDNDNTKAVSRSRIDRLCRRRDVPLREKTLWRMLYESAAAPARSWHSTLRTWTSPTSKPGSPPRAATRCGSPGARTRRTCYLA